MSSAPQDAYLARADVQPTVRRVLAAPVVGVVVGFAGTAMHRNGVVIPWGLALSGSLCFVGSVFVRAALSRLALAAYIPAVFATVLALTYGGVAGDVLVTGERVSMTWIVLSVVASALGWFAPRRWFLQRAHIDAVPVVEAQSDGKPVRGQDATDDGSITAP